MTIESTNDKLPTTPAITYSECYRLPFLSLFHADCMDIMKQYPDKYFDLAIVDPPYGVEIAKWDSEIPKDDYFIELFRVSKNQIIWGGNFFQLPPTRCFIVWNKKQWLKVRSSLEYAWTSFDTLPYYLEYTYCGNAEGLNSIKVDYKKKSIHPCQKPENIYTIILREYATEGMKILDTHFGSGSIALAVDKANRLDKMNLHLTACEIDKEYIDKAIKRISESIKQGTLSF